MQATTQQLTASQDTFTTGSGAARAGARRGRPALGALLAAVGTMRGVGGTSSLGAVGLVGMLAIGATPQCALAQCGDGELTQSTNPDLIQAGRAAWCGTLDFNDQTQIGRGFTAPYDLTISCVTFGVTRNTGADWPCHVRILGGGILEPHATRPVLAEATVNVPAGTTSEFFTTSLPAAFIPEGSAFIVELDTPSRNPATGGDGDLLSLGFNALGQSSPTYLRAEGCGLPEYTDMSGLGFANSHAAISVGVTEGYAVPVLGGFPVSPIGTVSVGTAGGEVAAYGDGGLSIELGDLTMGGSASFRVLSTGDEVEPSVEIGFHGATASEVLAFRNNGGDPNEAVLDVHSDDPAFDRFRVRVFLDGELVGTLENQTSGSVLLGDPGDAPLPWLKRIFDLHAKIGWSRDIDYFEGGGIKSESRSFCFKIGRAMVSSTGGGPGFVGDEITIEPMTPSGAGEPPLSLSMRGESVVGVAVDVGGLPPSVAVGQAETKVHPVGDEIRTQVGVSFKAINNKGVQSGSMYATELTGDGVADLRYVPGLAGEGEGVRMELGGVESASTGMDLTVADPLAACMTVCSFEVGPVSIPTGKTIFDPWPADPMFVAVQPDFTGVGDETYTFQAYDAFGTLVHEETGLQGIAGGASRWPSKIGKLGGATPCFVMCYPDLTLFRMAGGHEFDVHEVRVLVEGAPPAGPLSALDFGVQGMDELRLFDPVTELPDFAAPCYADLDGDGALTIFDFLAFQNAFAMGEAVADCDEDGTLTLFDFLCFQNSFAVGCP